MRNSNSRGKTLKKKLNKCKKVFYAYSELQYEYGTHLDMDDDLVEIRCNVKRPGCSVGDEYTSDFVCVKKNGEIMVRECVERSKFLRPSTCKLLDASRNYWLSKGIIDWSVVISGK